jgi:hypothetical protein
MNKKRSILNPAQIPSTKHEEMKREGVSSRFQCYTKPQRLASLHREYMT